MDARFDPPSWIEHPTHHLVPVISSTRTVYVWCRQGHVPNFRQLNHEHCSDLPEEIFLQVQQKLSTIDPYAYCSTSCTGDADGKSYSQDPNKLEMTGESTPPLAAIGQPDFPRINRALYTSAVTVKVTPEKHALLKRAIENSKLHRADFLRAIIDQAIDDLHAQK